MARAAQPPALTVPRPALRLLALVGHGRTEFTYGEAKQAAAAGAKVPDPKSTARHLQDLVDAGLILRLHKDAYASPGKPAHALLLAEPDAYARSLLLHADVLPRLGVSFAFACLPVRKALDFEIPRALPVLDLETLAQPILRRDAAHMALRKVRVSGQTLRLPTDGASDAHAVARDVPVLEPRLALGLLAATADPRLVHACYAAAAKLGTTRQAVLDAAASFVVEDEPSRHPQPNSLVLPRWLMDAARSAKSLHAQRFLDAAASDAEGEADG